MANVWYIGDYQKRQVFGHTFDVWNGWSLPEGYFTSAQLVTLDDDPGFLLGQIAGPRTYPAPPQSAVGNPGWTYYAALQSMYEAGVGMPFSRVIVVTGNEVRPAVDFVLWIGGGARPTHMGDGDLWCKHVGGVIPDPDPDPSDTTPPSVPSGLAAASLGQTSLTLNWTASSGTPSGYEVRRNGSSIATPTSNTLAQSGLTPGTEYTYAVRARDAAGNWSAWSTNLVVTTTAPGSIPEHTIWGSTAPGTPALMTDGTPGIRLGQKFYTYGVATGPGNLPTAKCVGGRVYLPAGHGMTAMKVFGWQNIGNDLGSAPGHLGSTPLREVTKDITGLSGWIEARWTAFDLTEGQFALIGYEFTNNIANYVSCVAARPNDGFLRALDNSKLVWAEHPFPACGTMYRIGTATTAQASNGGNSYGIDIIVAES